MSDDGYDGGGMGDDFEYGAGGCVVDYFVLGQYT
jgi:hypothetical protein